MRGEFQKGKITKFCVNIIAENGRQCTWMVQCNIRLKRRLFSVGVDVFLFHIKSILRQYYVIFETIVC